MTSRSVPASLARELNKQESAEALLVFIEVSHPSTSEVIRVVSDAVSYLIDDKEYVGFPFDIELLTDDENPPKARLSIQNVDQKIGETIRGLDTPPHLSLRVIAASEFDQTQTPRVPLDAPEWAYVADHLYLIDVECNVMELSGTISSWDPRQMSLGQRVTKASCPACYV